MIRGLTLLFVAITPVVLFAMGCENDTKDLTTKSPSKCRLHGVEMERVELPAICAEQLYVPEHAVEHFPNSPEVPVALGLCLTEEQKAVEFASVWRCQECEEARQNWEAAHKRNIATAGG